LVPISNEKSFRLTNMIEKLTLEQEKLLEKTRDKWLSLFFSGKEIDKEEAIKGIKWLYKFSNLREPIIIFLDSPLALQIGANIAPKIIEEFFKVSGKKIKNNKQVGAQVRSQVWSQVGSQVLSQVGSQVGAQVRSQVWSQVESQVRSQVWSQVLSQVESQVWSQVESQVGAQVRSQVWSQVGSQVGAQVRSQVWSQVGSQVESQVGSQVWSQVESQVWSQVWSQVLSQVRSQVGSQVESQVRSQVRSQVESQVGSQVGSQVESQVWSQVGSQVGSEKIKYIDFASYGRYWDYGWVSFYSFFEDIGVVKNEDFTKFKNLLSSGVYDMIQLDGVCLVSQLPKVVKRNSQNMLHSDKSPACEFRDGYKLYYLNGVHFPEELFKKVTNKEMSAKEILEIKDVDQRTQAMRFMPEEDMIKGLKGELLDEINKLDIDGNQVNYKLYKFPKGSVFSQDAYYCLFDCPSTRKKHMEGVEVSKTVAEAMAWSLSDEKAGVIVSPEEWLRLVPLVDEN